MSGVTHKKILAGFKKLQALPTESIIEATVKSVDADNLVLCEADGLSIPEVQLRPIKTGSNKGMIIIPKVGSVVLIGSIEGRQDYVIIGVNEAEKVLANIGNISFEINESEIKLNGDSHEGLVKVNDLVSRMNKMEKRTNELLTKLQNIIVPLAPSGTYPFAPLFGGLLPLAETKKSDIENEKVKHG